MNEITNQLQDINFADNEVSNENHSQDFSDKEVAIRLLKTGN